MLQSDKNAWVHNAYINGIHSIFFTEIFILLFGPIPTRNLEYTSVLWNPFTVTDAYQLERVQRRFLSREAYILK